MSIFPTFEDKEVTMIIPVRFEGNAPGVRLQGGVLSKNKRKQVRASKTCLILLLLTSLH